MQQHHAVSVIAAVGIYSIPIEVCTRSSGHMWSNIVSKGTSYSDQKHQHQHQQQQQQQQQQNKEWHLKRHWRLENWQKNAEQTSWWSWECDWHRLAPCRLPTKWNKFIWFRQKKNTHNCIAGTYWYIAIIGAKTKPRRLLHNVADVRAWMVMDYIRKWYYVSYVACFYKWLGVFCLCMSRVTGVTQLYEKYEKLCRRIVMFVKRFYIK